MKIIPNSSAWLAGIAQMAAVLAFVMPTAADDSARVVISNRGVAVTQVHAHFTNTRLSSLLEQMFDGVADAQYVFVANAAGVDPIVSLRFSGHFEDFIDVLRGALKRHRYDVAVSVRGVVQIVPALQRQRQQQPAYSSPPASVQNENHTATK